MPDRPDKPPLGEMPEPHAVPAAENPGGVDAINADVPFAGDQRKLGHDLLPEDNPAVEDVMPDEVTAPDDKQQAPSEDDDTDDPKKEDPV
jgi:hypothetical protein